MLAMLLGEDGWRGYGEVLDDSCFRRSRPVRSSRPIYAARAMGRSTGRVSIGKTPRGPLSGSCASVASIAVSTRLAAGSPPTGRAAAPPRAGGRGERAHAAGAEERRAWAPRPRRPDLRCALAASRLPHMG